MSEKKSTSRSETDTALQDETAITIDKFHQVMDDDDDDDTKVIGYKRPAKLESLSKGSLTVIEERKQLELLNGKSP